MAVHSSILTWRISWTEEPGRLWSMGLQRVGSGKIPPTPIYVTLCNGTLPVLSSKGRVSPLFNLGLTT